MERMRKAMRAETRQVLFALVALLVIFLTFTALSPRFFSLSNLIGILLATTVNGVLAVGITYVIIGAGIDLSVGTTMTFCAVMTATFMVRLGLPMGLGILGGVLMGGLCGLLNGLGVAWLNIPPFIMTLGMMMITKGLAMVIAETRPIYLSDYAGFDRIATGSVIGALTGVNIPNGILIMLAVALLSHLLLSRSILGRYAYAMGSNEESTRLSGINVRNWKTALYVLCGLMSGVAGVLMASRLNSAQPALGAGYEMDAIAASIIGGASPRGGEGSIAGTIIGAFIISVLTNGLRILSVSSEWQTVVTGVVVIAAVYADISRRK